MVSGFFTFKSRISALLALGCVCAAAVPAPTAASPAPAGILIENTAEASYDDAGITRTVTSNTVQVRVDELLDIAAATLEAAPVAVRPGAAVLPFRIENTGNGPEAFALEVVTAVAGNAFDTALDAIAADTNGNGAYDPGVDQILPGPSVTGSLASGASQTIFVILTVPTGFADGAQSEINLIARPQTGSGAPGTVLANAGEAGGDAVVGLSGGMAVATGRMVGSASTVTLVKWASVTDPFGGSAAVPGSTITYGIQALVSGSATVDGLTITDTIPASTRYVANSLRLGSAPLSDAAGDDAGEASAAGIAVNLGSLAGGSSNTVTFAVLIEQ